MKISLTEHDRFCTEWAEKKAYEWHSLRFGQAWFNYFNLQKHNSCCQIESLILSRLYNEKDEKKARATIRDNFIDVDN